VRRFAGACRFVCNNALALTKELIVQMNAVNGMASLKTRFRLDVSIRGVLETLLQKLSDFLLSGGFLHYSLVDVGYSAFAVNQRR
jgi:hypothetical protein